MNKNKTPLIIILAILLIMLFLCTDTEAATTKRYVTKTVKLSKDLTVKANTKVTLVKSGTKCTVSYKGGKYKIHKKHLSTLRAVKKYTGRYFKRAGGIRWKGYKYTWYSQRTLPGHGLKIPGRHLDSQGFVCDKDGYIVVGSNVANKRKRVIVATPFGKFGKCYDCGYVGPKHFDCYTAW